MRDLARKIKKYWRVFLCLRRLGLMNRMAYRVNFFIACFAVFLMMSFTIIFLKVIFRFAGNFGGWGYYPALMVAATFMIVEGLIWVMCACLGGVSRHIKDGSLDGLMVRPIDLQFLVSLWRGDSEDTARIITGVALLFYSLMNLSVEPAVLISRSFLYIILVFSGFIIVYSFYLMLRTLSFWFIETGALHNLGSVFVSASQYPASIFYHKIAQIVVFSVLPVAFIATVPAKILVYGFDWRLVLGSFLVSVIFFFGSRRFWLFALRRYSSASS